MRISSVGYMQFISGGSEAVVNWTTWQ